MNDKEILATVYRWMNQSIQRDEDEPTQARRLIDCRNFIDQEWQKQDDLKDWRNEVFAKADNGQTYKMPDDYGVDQGGSYERHRKLDIDEDGSVKGIE
jgi:hypothetical protein